MLDEHKVCMERWGIDTFILIKLYIIFNMRYNFKSIQELILFLKMILIPKHRREYYKFN